MKHNFFYWQDNWCHTLPKVLHALRLARPDNPMWQKKQPASEQSCNQNKSTCFRNHLPTHYVMGNSPAQTHTQMLNALISSHQSCLGSTQTSKVSQKWSNILWPLRSARFSGTPFDRGEKEKKIKYQISFLPWEPEASQFNKGFQLATHTQVLVELSCTHKKVFTDP